MENIKQLMHKYDKVQRATQEAPALRKQIVPLLKEAGMTKTKFNFGDRTISYHSYGDYEGITQALVRRLVNEKYPEIDSEQFIADLWGSRKKRTVETLRVQAARPTR